MSSILAMFKSGEAKNRGFLLKIFTKDKTARQHFSPSQMISFVEITGKIKTLLFSKGP